MATGVVYEDNFDVEKELYAVDSGYRSQGGFNLETAGLPAGSHLPVLAPLHIDFANRKASLVNRLKVVEAAAKGATSIKVQKNSFAKAGTYAVSEGNIVTVSKVDTSNEAYDVLTVTATTADIALGAVLYESDAQGKAVNTANALNYARKKVETGATVTALFRAYEIQEKELYIPVTEADKTSLTSRFMFV